MLCESVDERIAQLKRGSVSRVTQESEGSVLKYALLSVWDSLCDSRNGTNTALCMKTNTNDKNTA